MGYLEIRDKIESDYPPAVAWMVKGERRRNGKEEWIGGMG